MDLLLEQLKQQPETIKPEQQIDAENMKDKDLSVGGHCQGGGGGNW